MRTVELKRLNFHHLHYFWVVAKDGNLTRAARQLHISQSALSSQIRHLEDQLGHALFAREGRALRLTEVGHVVLGYAEGIFNLGRELLSSVSGGEGQASQQLRIGAVATLSRNFLENFLRPALHETQLQLVLESASLEELLERLRVHKIGLDPIQSPGSTGRKTIMAVQTYRPPAGVLGRATTQARPQISFSSRFTDRQAAVTGPQ
jgi:LysR family transcriptional activator of nhaA